MDPETTKLSLGELGQQCLNLFLMWVGVSCVVGCAAKLLVPGKGPHGTLPTLVIGCGGFTLGGFLLRLIYVNLLGAKDFNPASLLCISVSVGLACVGLFLYRLLTGGLAPKG